MGRRVETARDHEPVCGRADAGSFRGGLPLLVDHDPPLPLPHRANAVAAMLEEGARHRPLDIEPLDTARGGTAAGALDQVATVCAVDIPPQLPAQL